MTNEVLAKIVCHNLACLISTWYDLGIEPIFGAPSEAQEEFTTVQRFPG